MRYTLSRKNSIIILLLLLIPILFLIYMFNPFKKSPHYEIGETRDFSCPGMTEFTFKYPVFKGWKMSLEWLASDSTNVPYFFPITILTIQRRKRKTK